MTTVCPPPRGDEAALYAQFALKLARIVASRVRTSSANVDDACAFAWLQMLRHQPPRETLLAWLVTTGTREAIKLDRRARRHDEPTDDLTEAGCVSAEYPPIEAHLDLDVLAARDAVADAGLRPREAEILAAHVAGFSYAEIADAKCLTTRTVERQLLRAKHRLRAARERQRQRQQRNAEAAAAAAAAAVLPLTIVANVKGTFERPATAGRQRPSSQTSNGMRHPHLQSAATRPAGIRPTDGLAPPVSDGGDSQRPGPGSGTVDQCQADGAGSPQMRSR